MSDEKALQELAGKYFDALYFGNVDLFVEVFHPAAMLYCFAEREPVIMNVEKYLAVVKGRVSPAARGDRREDEIVTLEVATPTTAHLRVRELFLPKRFTDDLTLVKTADGWKIVSKVWHFTLDQ